MPSLRSSARNIWPRPCQIKKQGVVVVVFLPWPRLRLRSPSLRKTAKALLAASSKNSPLVPEVNNWQNVGGPGELFCFFFFLQCVLTGRLVYSKREGAPEQAARISCVGFVFALCYLVLLGFAAFNKCSLLCADCASSCKGDRSDRLAELGSNAGALQQKNVAAASSTFLFGGLVSSACLVGMFPREVSHERWLRVQLTRKARPLETARATRSDGVRWQGFGPWPYFTGREWWDFVSTPPDVHGLTSS